LDDDTSSDVDSVSESPNNHTVDIVLASASTILQIPYFENENFIPTYMTQQDHSFDIQGN